MMLVAAAAMSFTACSKDATEDLNPTEIKGATETITISTEMSTRTTLTSDRMKLQWAAGDQFAVYTDQGTKNTPVTAYAEGATDFELEVAAGSTEIYAYYPYYSGQGEGYDQTSVSMFVTSGQKQSAAGVFDGDTNDYAMVAKGTIDADKKVALTFKPVACALALNIYGGEAGETVKSVTFDPGVTCAGQHIMDITADAPVYTAANGAATSVTVTLTNPFESIEAPADAKTFDKQVYAIVARTEYAAGTKFVVTTSKNTYTFTTKKALDCSAVDFMPVNLDLTKGETPKVEEGVWEQVTALSDITEGKYIIVDTNDEGYLPNPSTNNAPVLVTFTSKNITIDSQNKCLVGTISSDMIWNFSGSSNSAITITNDAGNYLYHTNTNNGVRVGSTSATFAFAVNGTGFSAKDSTYNRYLGLSNTSSQWRCFTALSSSGFKNGGVIYLYKFRANDEPQPTTPNIAINPITAAIIGETAVSTTAYEVRNSDSEAIVSNVDGTVVTSASIDAEGLHYTVAPNYTGAARTGSISLALADDATVTADIVVSQAADVFTIETASIMLGNTVEDGAVTVKVTSTYPWTIANTDSRYTVSPESYDGTNVTGVRSVTITPTAANESEETLTFDSFTITRTTDEPTAKTITVGVSQNGESSDSSIIFDFSSVSETMAGGNTNYTKTVNPIILTGSLGTHNQNAPRENKEGSLRFYAGNTLNLTGATITKVVMTSTTSSYIGNWKDGDTSLTSTGTTITWEGSTSDLTLKTSSNARITNIEVYFK